ncbi:hypothetical protein ScPMuIL_007167 [Solemya velum]
MKGIRRSHQMFIQCFMSRGFLDAKEVKHLYKSCCETFGDAYLADEEERRKLLLEFVLTINNNLRQFHMEIKKGVSEEDGSNFYGLVNMSDNNITRLASDYTTNELELFKKIVEFIVVESATGEIGSIEVVNLTEKLDRRMSKNDAENLINRMEEDKWIRVKQGRISLGTRAILELEQYILSVYPDSATICNLCNKLCLKGQTCGSCDCKLHFHCASRLFRGQDEPKCPKAGCGEIWSHDIPNRDVTMRSTAVEQEDRHSRTRKRKLRH